MRTSEVCLSLKYDSNMKSAWHTVFNKCGEKIPSCPAEDLEVKSGKNAGAYIAIKIKPMTLYTLKTSLPLGLIPAH